jgi:predicted O-methyltransferase YrrM
MFEIGLNGGHSSFLCLMNNKDLKVYANDIAQFYKPCPEAHPEVYVCTAAETLSNIFGDRFTFIKGSCLEKVPEFVKQNNDLEIDVVHIDGDKTTYMKDFYNIEPLLVNNAMVIFDDTQQPNVANIVNELVKKGKLRRHSDFPTLSTKDHIYTNEILTYIKK